MNEIGQFTITVFMGFFAVVNPISNSALFVSLTKRKNQTEKILIAKKSLLISFFIIAFFAIFGKMMFEVLGITLPAVRLVGGVLLFAIGFHMLNNKDRIDESTNDDYDDISISPLAVPLLAGPGAIATAMNDATTDIPYAVPITIAMFFIICVLCFVSFIFGAKLMQTLGQGLTSIITRLMGLVLAVLGAQMLIEGIHGVLIAFGLLSRLPI